MSDHHYNPNSNVRNTSNEKSSLLIRQIVSSVSSASSAEKNDEQQQQQQPKGRADMTRTVVNLMKACLGTGCLALPYACQQGGILSFIIMLIAVAAWTIGSVQRLILCLQYLPPPSNNDGLDSSGSGVGYLEIMTNDHQDTHDAAAEEQNRRQGSGGSDSGKEEITGQASHLLSPTGPESSSSSSPPPDCTSTLGKVAWHAFGKMGLESVDVMMVLCLMGILVSYLVATLGFLQDTLVGRMGGRLFNAVIVSSVMFLLSLVPDLGYLSRASLVGLVLLAATFLVITCNGIYENDHIDVAAAAVAAAPTALALWPTSTTGFSRLYGVCIFAYGFVPLTYNFRESMRQPELLVNATLCALGGVTSVNALIGIGLYMLFPHVSGEILHELPSTGVLPTVTRLTMAVVAIMTAPLLIVPMGELLEGKWQLEEAALNNGASTSSRWKVRFGVCFVSLVIAVLFPSFVHVLSFVGCAFVGLVSFCVPPILLLRLRYIKYQQHHPPRPLTTGVVGRSGIATSTITKESSAADASFWSHSWVDVIMAIAGLVATIAGTISVVADSS